MIFLSDYFQNYLYFKQIKNDHPLVCFVYFHYPIFYKKIFCQIPKLNNMNIFLDFDLPIGTITRINEREKTGDELGQAQLRF